MKPPVFDVCHEAEVLHRVFADIGCLDCVRLWDRDTAVQIAATTPEGMTVIRHEGDVWKLQVETPYYSRTYLFDDEASCLREVAMCRVGYMFDDDTEARINAALHPSRHN